MEIGRLRIKEVLEEKGKTVQWLCDCLGITYANTSNIVNNKTSPSLDRLFEIAKYLEVNIIELFEKPQQGETIGVIRHNGKSYEINSIADIEKLLSEIKQK